MSPALPTGGQVRRVTRDASNYHSETKLTDVLGDVYVGVFAVAMAATMVFSLSTRLAPGEGPFRQAAQDGPGLAVGWIAVLPAIAAVAAFVGLVTRLGPLSLSGAESTWWLPLPVDRRSLLRPAAYRWPGIGLVVGAVCGAAISFAMPAGPAAMAGTTALFAALTVTLVITAGRLQSRPTAHRAIRVAADLVTAGVPLFGILMALSRTAPPGTTWIALPVAVVLLVVAIGLAVSWDRRLGDVHAVSLRHSGAVTDEALVAVLSLDTRALGRALAVRTESPRRARSSTMRWLTRVPRAWRPQAALITSDVLLFLRTPRQPVQVLVALGLPVLGLLVPDPGPASTIVLLLIGAYLASLATVEGARRAQISPGLDAAFPIGQRDVRLTRMALPIVVMEFWFIVITAVLGWRFGDPAWWVLLGMLSAPAWAAAAVRGAYRPNATFGGPTITSPMGALPPGLASSAVKGPDIAVIGSVPIVVALILGSTHPELLSLQVLLSGIAVAVALHQKTENPEEANPREKP
ncbi:hypothetical protein GCM10022223_38320 [Kineosporia mesophila]|uniref:ABC-2 type transport system permease protein n=1 Tax=Kineosporia mesophila TaxID=566012 RepID=A0ABP6ZUR6_9ACTN|nr:DUF6297 family protein [Kineosporia mesophila]MCD5348460.1 DUF6297 family protein [Kineosporia mesophila]